MNSHRISDFLISLLASLIAIIIILVIEKMRKPRLEIELGDSLEKNGNKWLRINVKNLRPCKIIDWVYGGNPAISCMAWIGFLKPNGEEAFKNEMFGRWSEFIHPDWRKLDTLGGDSQWILYDANKSIDIPSGEKAILDIAFKTSLDDFAYGWNTESYIHPNHKNPMWKLEKGKYLVSIRVKTGGREFVNKFLINNESFASFNIEEIPKNQ